MISITNKILRKKNQKSTNLNDVGLNDYFDSPVPILSDNNVDFVCNEIDDSYDYFIEYGLGSSTLYFIDKFSNYKLKIISVENSIDWFSNTIKYLKAKFTVKNSITKIIYFKIEEIYRFTRALDVENLAIPFALSRRKKWKEALLLGPLYRFSPKSNSKFSGIIPFWPLSRLLLRIFTFPLYLFFQHLRPARGEFKCGVGNISIVCRNVPPTMKDQYGESPSKNEYIDAGLIELREALKRTDQIVKAAFFIDGGPRAEIVRAILKMEDECSNLYPTIFLCEAHRAYYNEIVSQRPSGIFLAGSNLTINGQEVQGDPGMYDGAIMTYWFGKNSITKEELAKKEVWFYQKKSAKETGIANVSI